MANPFLPRDPEKKKKLEEQQYNAQQSGRIGGRFNDDNNPRFEQPKQYTKRPKLEYEYGKVGKTGVKAKPKYIPKITQGLLRIYDTTVDGSRERDRLVSEYANSYGDTGSLGYNPHAGITNYKAMEGMASLGFDVSEINDDFFNNNLHLRNDDRESATGYTPLAPNKNSTPEQNAAYWFREIQDAEENTKNAEAELKLIKREIDVNTRLGMGVEESIANIDWSKFPTLRKMEEARGRGEAVLLNRPVDFTEDMLYGYAWGRKNPDYDTGDPWTNALRYASGYGDIEPRPKQKKYGDKTSVNHDPYKMAGYTDIDYEDPKKKEEIASAETITLQAEKEIEIAKQVIKAGLINGKNAGDIVKELDQRNDLQTLFMLDNEQRNGNPVKLTRGLEFNFNNIGNYIHKYDIKDMEEREGADGLKSTMTPKEYLAKSEAEEKARAQTEANVKAEGEQPTVEATTVPTEKPTAEPTNTPRPTERPRFEWMGKPGVVDDKSLDIPFVHFEKTKDGDYTITADGISGLGIVKDKKGETIKPNLKYTAGGRITYAGNTFRIFLDKNVTQEEVDAVKVAIAEEADRLTALNIGISLEEYYKNRPDLKKQHLERLPILEAVMSGVKKTKTTSAATPSHVPLATPAPAPAPELTSVRTPEPQAVESNIVDSQPHILDKVDENTLKAVVAKSLKGNVSEEYKALIDEFWKGYKESGLIRSYTPNRNNGFLNQGKEHYSDRDFKRFELGDIATDVIDALESGKMTASEEADAMIQLWADKKEADERGITLAEYYVKYPEQSEDLAWVNGKITERDELAQQQAIELEEQKKKDTLDNNLIVGTKLSSGKMLSEDEQAWYDSTIATVNADDAVNDEAFNLELANVYSTIKESIIAGITDPQEAELERYNLENFAQTSQYKDELYNTGLFAKEILEDDYKLAKASGMTLAELYEARPELKRDAATITKVAQEKHKEWLDVKGDQGFWEWLTGNDYSGTKDNKGVGFFGTVGRTIGSGIVGAGTGFVDFAEVYGFGEAETDENGYKKAVMWYTTKYGVEGARQAYMTDALKSIENERDPAKKEQMEAMYDEVEDIFDFARVYDVRQENLTQGIENVGADMRETIQANDEYMLENGTKTENIAYDVGKSTVTSSVQMAGSIVLGSATGNPLLGTALMFGVSQAGESAKKALAEGKGRDYAMLHGLISGALTTILENAVNIKYFERASASVLRAGAINLRSLGGAGFKQASKTIWNGTKAMAVDMFTSMLEEGTQEGIESLAQNMLDKISLGIQKDFGTMLDEAGQAAVMGGISSMFLNLETKGVARLFDKVQKSRTNVSTEFRPGEGPIYDDVYNADAIRLEDISERDGRRGIERGTVYSEPPAGYNDVIEVAETGPLENITEQSESTTTVGEKAVVDENNVGDAEPVVVDNNQAVDTENAVVNDIANAEQAVESNPELDKAIEFRKEADKQIEKMYKNVYQDIKGLRNEMRQFDTPENLKAYIDNVVPDSVEQLSEILFDEHGNYKTRTRQQREAIENIIWISAIDNADISPELKQEMKDSINKVPVKGIENKPVTKKAKLFGYEIVLPENIDKNKAIEKGAAIQEAVKKEVNKRLSDMIVGEKGDQLSFVNQDGEVEINAVENVTESKVKNNAINVAEWYKEAYANDHTGINIIKNGQKYDNPASPFAQDLTIGHTESTQTFADLMKTVRNEDFDVYDSYYGTDKTLKNRLLGKLGEIYNSKEDLALIEAFKNEDSDYYESLRKTEQTEAEKPSVTAEQTEATTPDTSEQIDEFEQSYADTLMDDAEIDRLAKKSNEEIVAKQPQKSAKTQAIETEAAYIVADAVKSGVIQNDQSVVNASEEVKAVEKDINKLRADRDLAQKEFDKAKRKFEKLDVNSPEYATALEQLTETKNTLLEKRDIVNDENAKLKRAQNKETRAKREALNRVRKVANKQAVDLIEGAINNSTEITNNTVMDNLNGQMQTKAVHESPVADTLGMPQGEMEQAVDTNSMVEQSNVNSTEQTVGDNNTTEQTDTDSNNQALEGESVTEKLEKADKKLERGELPEIDVKKGHAKNYFVDKTMWSVDENRISNELKEFLYTDSDDNQHEILENEKITNEASDFVTDSLAKNNGDYKAISEYFMQQVENGTVTPTDAKIGQILTGKNNPYAKQVLEAYVEAGTGAGQVLQAFKLHKKMNPDIYVATESVEMKKELIKKIEANKPRFEKIRETVKKNYTELDGMTPKEQYNHLLSKYGLNNVKEVGGEGLFYNRATKKQRMRALIDYATQNGEVSIDLTGKMNETIDMMKGIDTNVALQLELLNNNETVITDVDRTYIVARYQEALDIKNEMDAYIESKNDNMTMFDDYYKALDREYRKAIGRTVEAVGNAAPKSLKDKYRSLRYINMLLSLPSAGRNVKGNLYMDALNTTSRGVANVIDTIISKRTGKKTISLNTDIKEGFKNWTSFMGEMKNTTMDYFTDFVDTSQGTEHKYNLNKGRTYQSGVLHTAQQLEGYLMSVGDRPFYEKALFKAMQEQARLNPKIRTNEKLFNQAFEKAVEQAKYATFTEDSAVVDKLSQLKQVKGLGTVIDYILPFTGVPTNIAKRAYEFSPVGFGVKLTKAIINAAQGKNFEQRQFAMDMGRGLTGTGMFAIGMLLKSMGALKIGTSDEDDANERGLRQHVGDQYGAYLDIGGYKIALSGGFPATMGWVLGAAVKEELDKAGKGNFGEGLMNGIMASTDTFLQSTYISGLSEIFTGTGTLSENFAVSVGSSVLSQSIPSLLRQIAQTVDYTVRDTNNKSIIMKSINKAVISAIPGLSQTLPAKIDLEGNEIKQRPMPLINPFYVTKDSGNWYTDELFWLSESTGDDSFIPTDKLYGAKDSITGVARPLELDEKELYKRQYGVMWSTGLLVDKEGNPMPIKNKQGDEVQFISIPELMKTDKYKNANDSEKVAMIKTAKSATDDILKATWQNKLGEAEKVDTEKYEKTTVVMPTWAIDSKQGNVAKVANMALETGNGNLVPNSLETFTANGVKYEITDENRDKAYAMYEGILETELGKLENWNEEDVAKIVSDAKDKFKTAWTKTKVEVPEWATDSKYKNIVAMNDYAVEKSNNDFVPKELASFEKNGVKYELTDKNKALWYEMYLNILDTELGAMETWSDEEALKIISGAPTKFKNAWVKQFKPKK